MKKSSIALGIVVLILVLGVLLIFVLRRSSGGISKVCFAEKCFNVEIADTPAKRETGLMFRESLPENQGMLFIFESSGEHDFWMKNTLIPLDMIWIDANLNVADIKTAEPCNESVCQLLAPEKDALYVLEINRGLAGENEIKVGDKVVIS
jgi:uncharacterized protein